MLNRTGDSPEEFGRRIGLSGMTIRRWLRKPEGFRIPRIYLPAMREACLALVAEGRLDPSLPEVQSLLFSASPSAGYRAALRNLGLGENFTQGRPVSRDQILSGLLQIGAQMPKQTDVEGHASEVSAFKKLGDEWSSRITTLWNIVRSRKLDLPDKFIAYGALFYLLTPVDFIPDNIPFFGLIDDFAILGLAASYYTRKSAGDS
ncbi:hypothetical protein LptCag_1697 [Leptospirillum ferriphilum]|jgi:uncharacterized membrane protein YkvA (DUF1232 family)|uniref:DUF1232 domain-containing protein n=3 Tax=Leptospirillum TaxID=179 RepID=A0A094W5W5_9BACT|nr:YkvA family protein [Leptospirillum ferriphilum]AFS53921.1 hypothetical protein LFML04_1719 [Leptospirillum ferriphilum ML-04]KGA92863.1 hypothetical protein LptCag_1697 [Leptospirillum ferriphilum]OOH73589.1 hypothetical protein BOX24_03675 [Leptospirillum ferriphilum]